MKLKQKITERFNISGKISQSYCGEDILLWRYFLDKKIRNGFFIDVGAYHPKYINNTWRLRKQLGFTGINIEPTDNIKLFRRYRKNDINCRCLIGDDICVKAFYYVDEEPMLSGTDENKITKKTNNFYHIRQTTLDQIVKVYDVKKIDLLDIDVEGTEMDVLIGHNWNIKPRLILIEDDRDYNNLISSFLRNINYRVIAKTLNNTLYEYTGAL